MGSPAPHPPPAFAGPGAVPKPSQAAEPPEAEPPPAQSTSAATTGAGLLNLNEATYEQLRERNLSVTQTGRVLAYRDRVGGFKSLDELDSIPGFPHSFLEELKRQLTV